MKELTLSLHDEIYEKVCIFASERGLEVEEAVKFIIGDALRFTGVAPMILPPLAPSKDPMTPLYKMMEAMGMCKCKDCTTPLTADEIMVNGAKCFKCKPDTRNLEF
ncbi:MAG: hypothetical protein PHO67_07990 [Candidatus Omnitrophica bacterium]|nr:hypothetical protein [Candidatus Omnitrophota bacterium]